MIIATDGLTAALEALAAGQDTIPSADLSPRQRRLIARLQARLAPGSAGQISPLFWQEVFQQLGEAATVFRGDGRAVAVNAACCALFGYSQEECTEPTFNWLNRFDKSDLPRIAAEIGKLAEGQARRVYYEATMTTKDGRRLLIGNTDTCLGIWPDQDPEPLFLCLMTNETQRRIELLQALETHKKELLEARGTWYAALEQLPLPIAALDETGVRLFMNRSYQAMIGATQLDQIVLEPQQQARLRALLQQARSDHAITGEFCLRHPQRGALPLICAMTRLPDDMRRHLGITYLLTLSDISALKERERAMEEQRAYFRDLFDSAPVAILVGDSHGHVHDANKTHAGLLDISTEELYSPGFNQFDFTPPEYHELDRSKISAFVATRQPVMWEKEYQRRDGSRVWVEVRMKSFDQPLPGQEDRWIVTMADVTRRKQLALALQKVIDTVRQGLLALRSGDFSMRWHERFEAEHAVLGEAMDSLAGVLQQTALQLQGSAGAVRQAAHAVEQGAHSLSQRLQEEAVSLEQSSNATSQTNVSAGDNAQRAARATELAHLVTEAAFHAAGSADEALTTMTAIASSSQEVGSFLQVIRSIAFHTNILALNATIEAAHAGEAGRGFAVVAGEVRRLSQGSARAAADVARVMARNAQIVEAGQRAVTTMHQALTGIKGRNTGLGQLLEAITQASTEQSGAMDQIAEALRDITRLTQNNAALVEQLVDAAASLSREATDLVQQASTMGHATHQKNQI